MNAVDGLLHHLHAVAGADDLPAGRQRQRRIDQCRRSARADQGKKIRPDVVARCVGDGDEWRDVGLVAGCVAVSERELRVGALQGRPRRMVKAAVRACNGVNAHAAFGAHDSAKTGTPCGTKPKT